MTDLTNPATPGTNSGVRTVRAVADAAGLPVVDVSRSLVTGYGDYYYRHVVNRVTTDGVSTYRGEGGYPRPMFELIDDTDRYDSYIYRSGPPIDETVWMTCGVVIEVQDDE